MKNKFVFTLIILIVIISINISLKCDYKASKAKITSQNIVLKTIKNKPDSIPKIYPNDKNNNCLNCHKGIEPIRNPKSGMMQAIYHKAKKAGYADNACIVCHGGSPTAKTKKEAHNGTIPYFINHEGPQLFYPDPASVWINDNTCGMCHKEQVKTQFTSLMFTEAGKIQGTTWGFGGLQGYEHNVANLPVKELEVHKRLGSKIYKKYIRNLKKHEPQVYPSSMKGLPTAPTEKEIEKNPALAAYSYLRTECERCHTGVKGSKSDGDYRGTGCGSCHIPYSNKGLYEGKDPTFDKKERGKLLVHSIQSTRDVKVKVHGHSYSGIPTKTCTACHNRGARIGVSFEGLMETSYSSPFMSDGDKQAKIHKKNYIHLKSDIHKQKGMLCQDCHTTGDMHGLGSLMGANLAAVEIECQDCHGTPDKYPWELPIGYGDEISTTSPMKGKARGVSQSIPDYYKKGSIEDKKEGYLISARGNPMPHLVKTGDSIILYAASGKNIVLNPLKKLKQENKLSPKAKVAMTEVSAHIDKLECYTCHATWAPQCYGCHVKIDYSHATLKTDWVEVAKNHLPNGQTADALSDKQLKKIHKYVTMGDINEERSFLRWEDPPLVVNGEHRISPAVPGCQTTVTVKDKNGKMRLLNHIFRIPNVEGAGQEGQLASDIAPIQPHTIQKEARDCESCHTNPKSMGYGINSGKLYYRPDTNFVMDLLDADGRPIAAQVDTQFNAIPNLKMDWSRFIDENDKQLQTVGHHFSGSRPLNKEELGKLDRRGVCLSCHKSVPKEDLAGNLMSHVAQYANVEIDTKEHTKILNKSILISAWTQVLVPFLFLGIFILIFIKWRKKRRNK